jgi:MoxR-like ATPase
MGFGDERLIVRPEAEVEGKHALDVVRELLDTVPVLETGPQKPRRG